MEIILYVNNSEKNKMNKSLSNSSSFLGTLKNETSILHPVILLETGNPSGFNYAYIPEFNRYYFITDMVSVNNSMWRVSMSVDVLESFKNYIVDVPAIVSNSEYVGASDYLTDAVWKTKVKEQTDIINFPSGLSDDGHFILITAGG